MSTYIIANGGCGARLASVILTLNTCGYYGVNDPIRGVLLVDRDAQNQSAQKLGALIGNIKNLTAALNTDNKNNTEPVYAHWEPRTDQRNGNTDATLENIANGDPDSKTVLSLLTTEAESQIQMNNCGYIGHVNVGVTSVYSVINSVQNTAFDQFLEDIIPSEGNPVRFIIAGSTHGGTGAALNVALGRKIKEHFTGRGINQFYSIEGLFMMSYYRVPEAEDNDSAITINSSQYRPADIDALRGYSKLNLETIFEHIILCGFDPLYHTSGVHALGGKEQSNYYHVAELMMAAGARAFFDGSLANNNNLYHAISLGGGYNPQNNIINWEQMIYAKELKKAIGAMSMFAMLARTGLFAQLLKDHKKKWLGKNQASDTDTFYATFDSTIGFFADFVDMLHQIDSTGRLTGSVDEEGNPKFFPETPGVEPRKVLLFNMAPLNPNANNAGELDNSCWAISSSNITYAVLDRMLKNVLGKDNTGTNIEVRPAHFLERIWNACQRVADSYC